MTNLDDAATQVQDWLTEKTRLELAHVCALKALLTHMGWPALLTVPFDGVEIEIRKVEQEPEMVWVDRVIYYTDGHKTIQRQYVPKTWCKHDDGRCHEEDPCTHCPQRQNRNGP